VVKRGVGVAGAPEKGGWRFVEDEGIEQATGKKCRAQREEITGNRGYTGSERMKENRNRKQGKGRRQGGSKRVCDSGTEAARGPGSEKRTFILGTGSSPRNHSKKSTRGRVLGGRGYQVLALGRRIHQKAKIKGERGGRGPQNNREM